MYWARLDRTIRTYKQRIIVIALLALALVLPQLDFGQLLARGSGIRSDSTIEQTRMQRGFDNSPSMQQVVSTNLANARQNIQSGAASQAIATGEMAEADSSQGAIAQPTPASTQGSPAEREAPYGMAEQFATMAEEFAPMMAESTCLLSATFFDYDNDGDLDIYVTTLQSCPEDSAGILRESRE